MSTENYDNENGSAAPKEPTMPPKDTSGGPTYIYNYPPPRHKSRLSNKPTVVGALLAIVAVLGLIMAGMFGVGMAFANNFEDWFPTEGDSVTIRGQVTSQNGTGIAGATVSVVNQALSTVTDSDGYYILYNVPTGDHKIQVSAEGYTTVVERVTVVSNSPMGPGMQSDSKDYEDHNYFLQQGTGSVETGSWTTTDIGEFTKWIYPCIVVFVVASLLAMLGAFYAFKRTNVHFVVVGAVAGIFTLGFGIGSILAFIALFILLMGMDEFRNGDNGDDLD